MNHSVPSMKFVDASVQQLSQQVEQATTATPTSGSIDKLLKSFASLREEYGKGIQALRDEQKEQENRHSKDMQAINVEKMRDVFVGFESDLGAHSTCKKLACGLK